jgi:hypothetical protein
MHIFVYVILRKWNFPHSEKQPTSLMEKNIFSLLFLPFPNALIVFYKANKPFKATATTLII